MTDEAIEQESATTSVPFTFPAISLEQAAAEAQEAVAALPKRRGRPPGSKNRVTGAEPKNVEPFGPEPQTTRRRGRPPGSRSKPVSVTPDDVSDALMFTHEMLAAFLGPEARITEDQARRIADRAVPVAEDFGVVVVGKVAHIVLLVAAIVSVEAPVAIGVVLKAQAQAQARKSGQITLNAPTAPTASPASPIAPGVDIEALSRMTGIAVGGANGAT